LNNDHFPTEESKLGYVLSRVEQPASDVLEPHLDDDAEERYTTHTQILDALETVYGVADKEYLYQGDFERLEQGNLDFNAFVAEFYRLSAPLHRDSSSLINSFRRKLSPTMRRLIMGRSNDTLSALIAFCRRLDVDLKLEQQIARKNNLNVPIARFFTPRSTGTTMANTAITPVPSAAPLNPHSFHRSNTPRIGITAAERERYMA
jgi:hypothetical protein